MLPAGCIVLYYVFDTHLFLQPQLNPFLQVPGNKLQINNTFHSYCDVTVRLPSLRILQTQWIKERNVLGLIK